MKSFMSLVEIIKKGLTFFMCSNLFILNILLLSLSLLYICTRSQVCPQFLRHSKYLFPFIQTCEVSNLPFPASACRFAWSAAFGTLPPVAAWLSAFCPVLLHGAAGTRRMALFSDNDPTGMASGIDPRERLFFMYTYETE